MGMGVDGVKDGRSEEAGQLDVIVGLVDLGIDDNTNLFLGASVLSKMVSLPLI
jgi:hypothetical protein